MKNPMASLFSDNAETAGDDWMMTVHLLMRSLPQSMLDKNE